MTRARPATAEDLPDLSQALAAAFLDDPLLSWCYPDAARRSAILPRFFGAIAEATLAGGGIYTTDDVLAGAIWVHPGMDTDDERTRSALYLRHGFEVTEEFRLPEGPSVWCMWRAPDDGNRGKASERGR